jgi:hypothetical protein
MPEAATWERRPYTGTCDACRTYWNTIQDLGEEWAAAVRADQPPISNQMARALVMYGEHVVAHLGPPAPEEAPDA